MAVQISTQQNFLPEDLDKRIRAYVDESAKEYRWRSNLTSWNGYVRQKSTTVSILNLDQFGDELNELYKDYIKSDWKIQPMYYVWPPMSYIPWHNDEHAKGASTIYMNYTWDINYGGLFMWRNEHAEMFMEKPDHNKMIFNSGIEHGVSMITPDALEPRQSIQIFWL